LLNVSLLTGALNRISDRPPRKNRAPIENSALSQPVNLRSSGLLCRRGGDKFIPMSPANPARETSPATSAGFHTTHWTVVLKARAEDGTAAQEALASLCGTYWYPLYAFIRRQGSSPHEAEDLTQEFFSRFLERHALERVRPAAGKFRSFLLVCLKNFLANERERAQSQRRGGGSQLIALDCEDAETRYSLEPADHRTPEAIFERRWAFALLERTLAELRREYAAGKKRDLFEALEGFLPGGKGSVSRAELAAKRGVSMGAIEVAIHRLRQRFGALLRQHVAQTVSSESEIEEEIHHLIAALSG
jgi:RNA polymerase sigma-70 factor (ECF subfamily)